MPQHTNKPLYAAAFYMFAFGIIDWIMPNASIWAKAGVALVLSAIATFFLLKGWYKYWNGRKHLR